MSQFMKSLVCVVGFALMVIGCSIPNMNNRTASGVNQGADATSSTDSGNMLLTQPVISPDQASPDLLSLELVNSSNGKKIEHAEPYRAGAPVVIASIPAGDYELKVEISKVGTVLLSSKTTASIKSGQTSQASVVLGPANGSLVITITVDIGDNACDRLLQMRPMACLNAQATCSYSAAGFRDYSRTGGCGAEGVRFELLREICLDHNPFSNIEFAKIVCAEKTSCPSLPVPSCPQPPSGYHYGPVKLDGNGCQVGCGELIKDEAGANACEKLKDPQMMVCAPGKYSCSYSSANGTPYKTSGFCGSTAVTHDLLKLICADHNPFSMDEYAKIVCAAEIGSCQPISCPAPPVGFHYASGSASVDSKGCALSCPLLLKN